MAIRDCNSASHNTHRTCSSGVNIVRDLTGGHQLVYEHKPAVKKTFSFPFGWHKPDTCMTISFQEIHFLFRTPFIWSFCTYVSDFFSHWLQLSQNFNFSLVTTNNPKAEWSFHPVTIMLLLLLFYNLQKNYLNKCWILFKVLLSHNVPGSSLKYCSYNSKSPFSFLKKGKQSESITFTSPPPHPAQKTEF
jgi:hypothetical protein